jgi:hypothetical protein
MKQSLKFSLILFVTLLIGIAIGFEISEILIKKRFAEPEQFRRPESFINMFNRIIMPDSIQKPLVDSILLKHHLKMESLFKNNMIEITAQMDSMKISLSHVLSKEQFKRFEEDMARMRKEPPGGMRQGPPGGMPMRQRPPNGMPMREGPPDGMKPMDRQRPDDMRMRREPPSDKPMRREP